MPAPDTAAGIVEHLRAFRSAEGGMLLVDKEPDWTSFDVTKKIRLALRVAKVGHAGTLDPAATGLLILCSNRMTKEIDRYQAEEKEYTGLFVLGAATPSHDAATPVSATASIDDVTAEIVREHAARFTGEIEQVPPMYSAVKIGGRRLYELARKGKEVERRPRRVTVREFRLEEILLPEVRFTLVCSKGTYVRSLVHDLGRSIGCGAYLKELRRTRIGGYRVEQALRVADIVRRARDGEPD